MDNKTAVQILARTIADDPGSLGGYHDEATANRVAEAMTHAMGEQWWAKEIREHWYLTKEDRPNEQA